MPLSYHYSATNDLTFNFDMSKNTSHVNTLKIEFTFDEVYQMNKLYDTMLDMDLTDDLPIEIETVFDKIREAEIDSLKSGT
tara:strand:+ start:392 stop:634 length:243 start_codon:yes stop_codon:yes gene_type:complete